MPSDSMLKMLIAVVSSFKNVTKIGMIYYFVTFILFSESIDSDKTMNLLLWSGCLTACFWAGEQHLKNRLEDLKNGLRN